MNLIDALVAIAALLALTVAVGVYLRWRQSQPHRHIAHEIVEPHRLGADKLGEVATLLQFSTELCARCPGVHRTLSAIADDHEGVRHLDVDLTHRPDIARHFHVLQTPTTLLLDRNGVVQTRFGGVPSREVLELELTRLTTETANA
ncbi:thioredoxin family protein [Microbacterium thalassium]|uniref:TlpA family protein disulfide reductase n=1 Tax=Microbacterium TaxID=33882 RepID=UPI001469C73C|nr:thioredoxin family protein [Microbacterium thalassium]